MARRHDVSISSIWLGFRPNAIARYKVSQSGISKSSTRLREFLPEVERTPSLFASLSEQPAASLLDLIDEECEHHEVGEDGR